MIKIIVVDDYAPARTRIELYLKQLTGYHLLASVTDGFEVIKYCKKEKTLPDIIFLDMLMPILDGVSTMEYLHIYFPDIKVIGLSAHIEKEVVLTMLACGAWGYVFKDKCLDMIADALQSIKKDLPFVDPRMLIDASQRTHLIEKRAKERALGFEKLGITQKEKEIISLIVSTLNYAEIGTLLNITSKSVENAVQVLNTKLGVENGRAGLLLYSIRCGLAKMLNLESSKLNV